MPDATPAQVNQLIKNLNAALITTGLQGMKRAFKFVPKQVGTGFMYSAFSNVGINITSSQKDIWHWTTDWNIWEACLDVITNIAKGFPWTEEKFDCDQRASFVKTLADIFLGINSACVIYGKICKKDGTVIALHYFNGIVTSDGKLYIYDVDFGNRGLVTNIDPVVGDNKYKIISVNFY